MTQPLVDGYGRVHRDLRISVTDRCNLRCTYCMPAEGMNWLPRAELLTFEEIERVARLMVERFGFTSIRLTGGEPTVRARLPVLVERLAALDVDLSLTTNATSLGLIAHDLAAAGLRRVNISLDSLRRERVIELTRRDCLDAGARRDRCRARRRAHAREGNAVLVRGVNDDEVLDFATFGRERGVSVRFIEFMPLDASGEWSVDKVVSRDEIVATIDAVYPVEPPEAVRRCGAGRDLPLPRRRRRLRGDRQRHQRVLRRRATGSGSPRTASCARACSPSTRPISGPCCGAAGPMTISRRP